MKRCHLVTFVLTVWLLMLPQTNRVGRLPFEPEVSWEPLETFDTEDACESMRQMLIERMPRTTISAARCVSSDNEGPQVIPDSPPKVGNITGLEGVI